MRLMNMSINQMKYDFVSQLSHQYRVIAEDGLPHEKRFTVCLELGDERYMANGKTIKMAQQSAAKKALEHTKYERPVARQARSTYSRNRSADKPSESLNANLSFCIGVTDSSY